MFKRAFTSEREALNNLISSCVTRSDFFAAKVHQISVVQLIERDHNCSSGELGEAMLRLAEFSIQTEDYKSAQLYVTRAIGFLRIYFGKNHERVNQSLSLAKHIQEELVRTGHLPTPRRRRRSSNTAEKPSI